MSLTSNLSHKVNIGNGKFRRKQQRIASYYPNQFQKDADILSQTANTAINRQNLNQASASSFVLSETRGETTAQYANSKNISPETSLNKLA